MRSSSMLPLLLGFMLLVAPVAFAELPAESVSPFCSSASGVREIKAYVNCQSDPRLGACAGLESRQAGRAPVAPIVIPSANALEMRRKEFVDGLTNELNKDWAQREEAQARTQKFGELPGLRSEQSRLSDEIDAFRKEHQIGERRDASGMSPKEKNLARARMGEIQVEIQKTAERLESVPAGSRDFLERKLAALNDEFLGLRGKIDVMVEVEPTSANIKRMEEMLAALENQSGGSPSEIKMRETNRQSLRERIAAERTAIRDRYSALKAEEHAVRNKIIKIQNGGVADPIRGTTTALDPEYTGVPRADNINVPKEVHVDHRRQAEAIYQEVRAQALAGKQITPEAAEELLKRHATSLFANYDQLSFAEQLKAGLPARMSRMQDATMKLANELLARSTAGLVANPTLAAGASTAGEMGSALADRQAEILAARSSVSARIAGVGATGTRALAAVNHPYAIAALLAAEVFRPGSGGCADNSAHVNADSSNDCKPRYEVNQDVVRFLDLPEEEQAKILRATPSVCDFYEKLHAKLFVKTRYERLTCKGTGGFVLSTKSPDGQFIEHDVSFNEKKEIRRVELARDGGPYGELRFNPDGTLFSSLESPGNLEKMMRLKMYLFEAKDCCLAGDDARSKCLDHFNQRSPSPASKVTAPKSTQPIR